MRWATFAVTLGVLVGPASMAPGADRLVTLDGWAGTGTLLRGGGLGGDLVRLIAESRWEADAPRDPLRYAIRSTFPDGHAETRAFPVEEPPGRARFVVYLPASSVRNLPTGAVRVEVAVVDAATGVVVGNPLTATIREFPRPQGDPTAIDDRPFGWGKPLEVGGNSAPSLPNLSPDGFRFVRVPGAGLDAPSFTLATTEATVAQVVARIPDYNPKAGRSDEFTLEAGDQPAVALTPARALAFVKGLGTNDPTGASYRLPTAFEWERAAKAGKLSAFWWGDGPTHPEGANFLGAEPALPTDTTAPSLPSDDVSPNFVANPFGLFHTFGNVAEWARTPDGGFARLGGHFRTEPASPLPEVLVNNEDELGPDPFVGVRPVLDLTGPNVAAIVRNRLGTDPKLAQIQASYDPDRGVVTLLGKLDDPSTRRLADQILEGIWFVAAVDNRIETPRPFPGQLATLTASPEGGRVRAVLDRSFVDIPVAVRWFDPLPVVGSDWWVNIYLPSGEHLAHKLTESEAGRSPKALVSVDRSRLAANNLADSTQFSVAISLGQPAPTTSDPRIVSNILAVKPVIRPRLLR